MHKRIDTHTYINRERERERERARRSRIDTYTVMSQHDGKHAHE
jgi:hypothetical protein